MLGQLMYDSEKKGRPKPETVGLYGLPVQRVVCSPDGFRAERRLKQAGRLLARAGCRRVLVPEGFCRWEVLRRYGLRPVDPVFFLRVHAVPLVMAGLKRQGKEPERCGVALRGEQMERELAAAAEELCPLVKDVCISVPGGEVLRDHLRWEYGVAVRPDYPEVDGAVRFHAKTGEKGGIVLNLFPEELDLRGISVRAEGVEPGKTEYLPLLAALWEAGRIQSHELEFT